MIRASIIILGVPVLEGNPNWVLFLMAFRVGCYF
jgi:hypothetical protein